MKTKRIKLCEITTTVLHIGFVGEQNHRRFEIDASEVFADMPDAVPTMTIKPPVGDVYPKNVQKSGNIVVWDVSASDVTSKGAGEYQLTFTNGNEIGKVFNGNFFVYDSIVGNGNAPTPVEDWAEEANALLAALENISASAETLSPGSEATAEVTDVGGHKNIAFGIPAGAPGQDGEPGQDGAPGKDGTDGVSPVVTVTDIMGGHRISITDATGTNTFDVLNGTNGTDGQDGYSPTVSVTDITGGHRVSITDATGTETFDVMDGQSGGVTDVQVNGSSVVTSGVANVPKADANTLGVVILDNGSVGLANFLGVQKLTINSRPTTYVKIEDQHTAITASMQHDSVFYGLAKASGDTTQKNSSNAVGTYTEDALSKISDMLNAPVSVSGSTPSITAKSGVRYICGEVSTLSITAPASGCIDVVFSSGSTATVLTVASAKSGVSAIKWVGADDPTALEANKTYEINILDGEYGVIASWT